MDAIDTWGIRAETAHLASSERDSGGWGMAQRMILSVRNCEKCRIFEAKPQIPPMEPIL